MRADFNCSHAKKQDGGPLNPVFGGGWGNPNPGFDLSADENGMHMAPKQPTSRLMGSFLLPPGSGPHVVCNSLHRPFADRALHTDSYTMGLQEKGTHRSKVLRLLICA